MDESQKEKQLNRLMTARLRSKRVAFFSNVLIVLYIIYAVFTFCLNLFEDGYYGPDFPILLIILLIYVVKVVAVEYLNSRADALEKDLHCYFKNEETE